MKRFLFAALAVAFLGSTSPTWADDDPKLAKWKEHVGALPFLIGFDKGAAEAKATGRPMLLFFTATW